jgi:hypothetical protein
MHPAIGADMLFQKEGCQTIAKSTGHVLPFREGHQLILVGLSEHPLKGFCCALQPALPKCLPILPAQK